MEQYRYSSPAGDAIRTDGSQTRLMAEGLSPVEVGKEIGEHAEHASGHHGRALPIAEAIVLSLVAIIAAWSGYSAAKWSTESSLNLAKASATRVKANRAFGESLVNRVGDATTFNAWFGAYVSGNKQAVAVAERRFQPGYRAAFDAWLATHPFTNPNAPAGPAAMPQYKPQGEAQSVALDMPPTPTTTAARRQPRPATSTSARR